MIKLKRPPAPEELTSERVKELTEEFNRDNSKRVWNKDYIKKALLEMSHNKCCYCECKIDEESKYPEVEHFHPKSLYGDEVVVWDNLLPSCKRCNVKKGNHDTLKKPVLNPTVDEPRDHLNLKNYRFNNEVVYRIKSKTELGQDSITLLSLNDSDRLLLVRTKRGRELKDGLGDLFNLAERLDDGENYWKRIINGIKGMQKQCLPESEYTGTLSSIVINDEHYRKLRELLTQKSLWDREHQENDRIMHLYSLDMVN